MIGAFEWAIVAVSVLAGLVPVGMALRGLGPVARLWLDRTTSMTDLKAGPIELVGTIRAIDAPLRNHRGEPAVVLRRIYSTVEVGSKGRTVQHDVVDKLRGVSAELREGDRTCELDFTDVLLVADTDQWTTDAATLEAEHPEAWDDIRNVAPNASEVRVQEQSVPDGARCVVSATAFEGGRATAGSDYRRSGAAFRVAGTFDRAMILAAADERKVRRVLVHRTARLWLLALAWWSLAAGAIYATRALQRIAGL